MATSRIKTSSVLQGFPKSRSLLAGNAAYSPDNFESIATVIVGSGGSSSITFSSIPGTYAHLQLRWIGRNTSTNSTIVKIGFDSADTTYWHLLYGDGGSAGAAAESEANPRIGNIPLSSQTASAFGAGITDILDYADTNKYKTLRSLAGYDVNGSGGYALVYSGLWKSTSAITTITISPGANNFAQYSKFALYGIRD